jgi:exopolysaccharide biosynthesis polyprenyl glycosylphosphotransferase
VISATNRRSLALAAEASAAAESEARPLAELAESPATPFPIVLQQRARSARLTHLKRGLARVAVLLTADAMMLLALRSVWTQLRAWSGEQIGGAWPVIPPMLGQGAPFPSVELVSGVVLGLWALGTYRAGDHRRNVAKVFLGAALGATLIGWGPLWEHPTAINLLRLAAAACAVGTVAVLERQLIELIVERARAGARHAPRAVLIGPAVDARRALRGTPFNARAEFAVVGYISTDERVPVDALGGIIQLIDVVAAHEVDTVIFAGHIDERLFNDLLMIADCAGCHAYALARPAILTGYVPQLVWLRGTPLVQLTRPGLHGQQLVIKRVVDVAAAAVGLVVLTPVFAAVALAVRLSSPGPIIFRQRRVGAGGRQFDILKFRSMVDGAESQRGSLSEQSIYEDARLFKVHQDPRVTRLGRFLRRTSLDELPQLWNVMRGEMSLVGPRPPLPSEVALYEEHHYSRFDMKPGITGPWQVNGRNRVTDFDEVIRLETAYLRRWMIWKDVAILLRTIPVVLKMDGAH